MKGFYIQFFVVSLCLEELYGEFEDLETGEVQKGQTEQQDPAEVGPDHLPLTDLTIESVFLCGGYSLVFSCATVPVVI